MKRLKNKILLFRLQSDSSALAILYAIVVAYPQLGFRFRGAIQLHNP